tara:strand:- start:38005 stop:38952 length:948 start_codon:yes stop_codon:yes gene_type:complete
VKRFLLAGLIIGASSLLAGCPLPTSDTGVLSNISAANDYQLPHQPDANKGVVYIVSNYSQVDYVIPGMGAFSDAYEYNGSSVSIEKNGLNYPIGTVTLFKNLCFYAPSGAYTVHITSDHHASPRSLKKTITVKNNQANIYALYVHINAMTTGGNAKLRFGNIDKPKGRYLVKTSPPKQCVTLSQLTGGYKKDSFKLTLVNQADVPLKLGINYYSPDDKKLPEMVLAPKSRKRLPTVTSSNGRVTGLRMTVKKPDHNRGGTYDLLLKQADQRYFSEHHWGSFSEPAVNSSSQCQHRLENNARVTDCVLTFVNRKKR